MSVLFLLWLSVLPCMIAYKLGRAYGKTRETKRLTDGTPANHAISIPDRFRMLGYVVRDKLVAPSFCRVGELEAIRKKDSTCHYCKTQWYRLYQIIESAKPGMSIKIVLCGFCPKCGNAIKLKSTDEGLTPIVDMGKPCLLYGALPADETNLHDLLDLMEDTQKKLEMGGKDDVAHDEILEAIIATKPKALPAPEAAAV